MPKMQITALDPGVTVNFNGIKMTAPGATAKIGRMPYLHQHPDWLLNVPDNVFGEYHLSFRVIAAGYRPSPSYTATLSNIPVATTTTTTIPGQTCLPGACDDHDDVHGRLPASAARARTSRRPVSTRSAAA